MLLRIEIICVNYLAKWLRRSRYSSFIEWQPIVSYWEGNGYYYFNLFNYELLSTVVTGRDCTRVGLLKNTSYEIKLCFSSYVQGRVIEKIYTPTRNHEKQIQYVKQSFSRHWILGKEGQLPLKKGKQIRGVLWLPYVSALGISSS